MESQRAPCLCEPSLRSFPWPATKDRVPPERPTPLCKPQSSLSNLRPCVCLRVITWETGPTSCMPICMLMQPGLWKMVSRTRPAGTDYRFHVWGERMSHSHHEPPTTEMQPGPGTPLGDDEEMSSRANTLTLFLIMPGTGSIFISTQSVKDSNCIAELMWNQCGKLKIKMQKRGKSVTGDNIK